MQIIRLICLIVSVTGAIACSNVKVALYDANKRQEIALESKKAFSKSDAGKALATKSAMIATARSYMGTKYKYGGIDPKQGFDCSGLVYYSAKKNNIELPRSSGSLAASATHIPWKKANPGDLVFFGDRGKIDHVGIIEKNHANELWVIHSTTKRGVYYENVLVSTYWKKRILFAVDFTDLTNNIRKPKS